MDNDEMAGKPKAAQVMAEATVMEERTDSPGAAFVAGLFTALLIADRHPESVGIAIKQMMLGIATPMPQEVYDSAARRADRIALATDDGQTPEDRMGAVIMDLLAETQEEHEALNPGDQNYG